ncbi:MAG: ROK family protein [Janthinobacterium lividum]
MQQPKHTIGVDLGGTSIRVGLFNQAMELKATRTMPTRVVEGPDFAVAEMAAAIAAVQAELHLKQTPSIGVGSPGPIDLREGVLGLLPNLPGWENFPLRQALAHATHTTVVLESDANAAALAEWKLGAGRASRTDHMAMLTLGTGVGSGLILNGTIWHCMSGMAGEIGHASIVAEGDPCPCGSRGCLELYTCASAVVRFFLQFSATQAPRTQDAALSSAPHTARSIAVLAQHGDPAALAAYQRLGHFLGIGIANLISTLDLPLIVVGGGVAEAWNFFADSMFQAAASYSVVFRLARPLQPAIPQPDKISVVPAALGPVAGLMGALLPGFCRPAATLLHAPAAAASLGETQPAQR